MNRFWRWFWIVRLVVAGYLTYRALVAWGDVKQLAQEILIISIWTMWTTDLPEGKD